VTCCPTDVTIVMNTLRKEIDMNVERVVEIIEINLRGIVREEEQESILLKEFILNYLRSRAGSMSVAMVLVKPDHRWMNEYIKLDVHAFYTEQNEVYFEDPEQKGHLATLIIAPLVLGLFKETDPWNSNEVRVETFLTAVQKATDILLEK
jgi:hypothetical protein